MFAVWYSIDNGPETIVGITGRRSMADTMARNLYSVKKNIDDMKNVSTGIYLMEDSMLYTSSKPRRWQVTPLRSSDNHRQER
jgi:hypothetical protein